MVNKASKVWAVETKDWERQVRQELDLELELSEEVAPRKYMTSLAGHKSTDT